MSYRTFTLVVSVFGSLMVTAQISPGPDITAHPCNVFHIGNQSFVRCLFNIKDQRADFHLEYEDKDEKENKLTRAALSCLWIKDQAERPVCHGRDGYSLNSIINGNVTFEVPSNGIESKLYHCRVNMKIHPPCNATSSTCPPLPSATSTSTATPPKLEESNGDTIKGTHITIMVCVGLLVVLGISVTAFVLVFILFRRRAKSRKDEESGNGGESSNPENQGLLMAERENKRLDDDSSKTQIPGAIATPQRMTNPMMQTPQRVFSFIPKTANDRKEPWIISIVCTQLGTLVMIDINNNKVKVIELNSPHTVIASITLDEKPRRLALLSDSLVAVTTETKIIYILDIDGEITEQSRAKTKRQYLGICASIDKLSLIVGCEKDSEGPASVDMIDHSGRVLRTVIDSTTYAFLSRPDYMCIAYNHLYISDYEAHAVLKVEVETGRVVEELQHTDMKSPCQVCVDKGGNIYIACVGDQCVLVRSGNGEWRRLLDARQHSEERYNGPYGVCVTTNGVVVVAWFRLLCSRLTGYQLK